MTFTSPTLTTMLRWLMRISGLRLDAYARGSTFCSPPLPLPPKWEVRYRSDDDGDTRTDSRCGRGGGRSGPVRSGPIRPGPSVLGSHKRRRNLPSLKVATHQFPNWNAAKRITISHLPCTRACAQTSFLPWNLNRSPAEELAEQRAGDRCCCCC